MSRGMRASAIPRWISNYVTGRRRVGLREARGFDPVLPGEIGAPLRCRTKGCMILCFARDVCVCRRARVQRGSCARLDPLLNSEILRRASRSRLVKYPRDDERSSGIRRHVVDRARHGVQAGRDGTVKARVRGRRNGEAQSYLSIYSL